MRVIRFNSDKIKYIILAFFSAVIISILAISIYRWLFNSSSTLVSSRCLKTSSEINRLIEWEKSDEKNLATNYDALDFEGFDNNAEPDVFHRRLLVPNYIHLIYLNIEEIEFYQCVNIYSIFLNQKPDKIFIHCDRCDFGGFYWDQLNSIEEIKRILVINKIDHHNTIFGHKVRWIQHRSDLIRIQVLMNYGGIYLDNDMYVVNSLNKYRVYEMTVSWDKKQKAIGNQVLIANRNSRFLRAYFDSYRTNFTPNIWYYNAGEVPVKILKQHGYLAHSVPLKLGTHMLVKYLYKQYWPDWRHLDSIHLLMGHRSYLDKNSTIRVFDEKNIQSYNFTYGEMCREVLKNIRPFLKKRIFHRH